MQKTNQKLIQYVNQLIQGRVTKEQIKNQLEAVGWSENEADEVYSQALIAQGIPVPSETMRSTFGKKSSTLESVLNLFSFVLLGIVAVALGTLFYQIINKYFPDPLANTYKGRVLTGSIHYAIAVLIIGFPTYYFSLYMWFRGFKKDEGKTESKLTKWLTYLILFIVSNVIIGDLIASVYTLLQGELTGRFFLKAFTILTIAGAIFGFYFLERRKIQYHKVIKEKVFKIFGWVVAVVILVAIIMGFIVSGSPSKERQRRFDQQRISDLSSITNCVKGYATKYKRLPNSLSELGKSASYAYCAGKKDPKTKKAYEYRVISSSVTKGLVREGKFELCADFSLKAENGESGKGIGNYYYTRNNAYRWKNHSAGHNCQQITVKLGDTKRVLPPLYK